jgi:hypothetical protein
MSSSDVSCTVQCIIYVAQYLLNTLRILNGTGRRSCHGRSHVVTCTRLESGPSLQFALKRGPVVCKDSRSISVDKCTTRPGNKCVAGNNAVFTWKPPWRLESWAKATVRHNISNSRSHDPTSREKVKYVLTMTPGPNWIVLQQQRDANWKHTIPSGSPRPRRDQSNPYTLEINNIRASIDSLNHRIFKR